VFAVLQTDRQTGRERERELWKRPIGSLFGPLVNESATQKSLSTVFFVWLDRPPRHATASQSAVALCALCN